MTRKNSLTSNHGKSTNFIWLYQSTLDADNTKLLTLPYYTDRMIFFDLLT